MRCKICKKVVRTANKPSRTRLVCGICLRSTKKLLKTIPLVVINGEKINRKICRFNWCYYCNSYNHLPINSRTELLKMNKKQKKLLLAELKRRVEVLS